MICTRKVSSMKMVPSSNDFFWQYNAFKLHNYLLWLNASFLILFDLNCSIWPSSSFLSHILYLLLPLLLSVTLTFHLFLIEVLVVGIDSQLVFYQSRSCNTFSYLSFFCFLLPKNSGKWVVLQNLQSLITTIWYKHSSLKLLIIRIVILRIFQIIKPYLKSKCWNWKLELNQNLEFNKKLTLIEFESSLSY